MAAVHTYAAQRKWENGKPMGMTEKQAAGIEEVVRILVMVVVVVVVVVITPPPPSLAPLPSVTTIDPPRSSDPPRDFTKNAICQ